MKKFLLSIAIPALAVSGFSQSAFQTEAILGKEDGSSFQAWILAATDKQIRYKTTAVSTDFTDSKITDFSAIFLKEPAEYSLAMDLYEARKYKEAKAKFAEVKATFKPVATLDNNHHTLAGFYEMECMRKLSDYEGLGKALEAFIKAPLKRENHLRQLDLYIMWDAVRSLSWDRVLLIATEREQEALPGYQRAQVAFCKGLALQNLERGQEAIVAYNIAITADAGASEIITEEATLNTLRIYYSDPEVQTAIKVWGTDDENKNSGGFTRLTEAAALAKLYDKLLKVDKPLPADLAKFLKYGV